MFVSIILLHHIDLRIESIIQGNHINMGSDKIKQQVDLKITNQLYSHSPFAIFSTIFNTFVVVAVFRNIAPPVILHTWQLSLFSTCCFGSFLVVTSLIKRSHSRTLKQD